MTSPHNGQRRRVANIAALVDNSPNGICVSQDERIVYVNAAWVRMFDAGSPTQVVGHPMAEFHPPQVLVAIQERFARVPETGDSSPAEYELPRTEGGVLRVQAVTTRMHWAGRPAFRTVLREVTTDGAVPAAVHYRAALIQHVSDAIIGITHDGVVTDWNPAAETIYGRTTEQVLGQRVADVIGADLDPAALVTAGGVAETRHRRVDGSTLAIRVSVAEMASGFVLVCADETAQRQAEHTHATVLDALSEGVLVISPTGLIESANPAASHILGVPREHLIGTPVHYWPLYDQAGMDVSRESGPTAPTRRTGRPRDNMVVRTRRGDGSDVWIALATRSLTPNGPGPHRVVASFTDITEARATHERLHRDATQDPLTGLANRTVLLEHLDATLTGQHPDWVTAVLFVDLDKFKVINDSLGHRLGDAVLTIVGQRLRQHVRRADLVGRLGGDEFVVLARRRSDTVEEIQALAEHLRQCLTEPIHIEDRRLHVDACIGITLASPGDSRTPDDILRDADVAMYQAKTHGRGRVAFFDVPLRQHMQHTLSLHQDLCEAIRRGQLWMAYQPIIDLGTGHTVAAEGLLRWTHPQHGPVPPQEFIPLAEHSDLIHHIGAHVLHTAFGEFAAFRTRYHYPLRLTVNLSARQLDDPRLPTTVHTALATTGLPACAVGLEITESTLMNDQAAAAHVLTALRHHGCTLAIDDFGTGYSSLAQLHQLPLDTLKIDRCFTAELGDTSGTEAIVSSTIAMAHALGLTVIAEGVETARQLAALRRLGCDQAQGYHLAHPAPIHQLTHAITAGKAPVGGFVSSSM